MVMAVSMVMVIRGMEGRRWNERYKRRCRGGWMDELRNVDVVDGAGDGDGDGDDDGGSAGSGGGVGAWWEWIQVL